MKKGLLFILFLAFSFAFTLDVNAGICDYTELARLKAMASNVNISYYYDYNLESDSVSFSILIENLKEDIIVRDPFLREYIYNGESTLVLKDDFIEGRKYRFEVITDKTMCNNKVLVEKYINLPVYNTFSNDEICSNIDYYMCDMWYQHGLSEKEFTKKINDYKENIKEENENPEIDDLKDFIISFIINNYYYFIGGCVIIVIIIYIVRSKDDFDLSTD